MPKPKVNRPNSITIDNHSRMEYAADLGRRALSRVDLDTLVSQVTEAITAYLKVEFSSFLELQPDGKAFVLGGVGWRSGIVGATTMELDSELATGYAIRRQTAVVINDLQADAAFKVSDLVREHGIVSAVIVPLYGQTRPLGALGAYSTKHRHFSADDVAWLQVVANALASQIEQKWLPNHASDKRLLRAEQMMAIGQVAAGVAHELRNPLTSIKGLIQINLRELENRGLPADDLGVIEHEIRRMERTLQTFLDFARPPKPNRQSLELTGVIERVLSLVSGRARKQEVSLKLSQGAIPVMAFFDQDQIQQLLLNLVLNALDAMPKGGLLEIDLQPPRDGFIEVYVRDTGPGIAPDILPKVFETFVSSKETGIGLGLPLSRRIAEEHGGSLTAYNLPATGACFVLKLPA